MAEPEEVSEWQKLPTSLQLDFYTLAEEEARRQAELLDKLRGKLKELRELISDLFRPVEACDWRGLRVAFVDGSFSPVMEHRLLGRYGVYCAGYHIYEGQELVKAEFPVANVVFRPYGEHTTIARYVLSLETALAERLLALRCLREEGVDYVVVDGSFFGFVRPCLVLRERPVEVERFGTSDKLVEELVRATVDLLKSGRAVGVVKRVRQRVIDSWLLVQNADYVESVPSSARDYEVCLHRVREVTVGAIDKAILSVLLPEGHTFSYHDRLAGEPPWAFFYYARLVVLYTLWTSRRRVVEDVGYTLARHRSALEARYRRAFGDDAFELIAEKAGRLYLRAHAEAPACCIEAYKNVELAPILAYFASFANEETGHPMPLDLVDDDVTLPRLFTREFVEEVEARLIGRVDARAMRMFFNYLNPQKKWRY